MRRIWRDGVKLITKTFAYRCISGKPPRPARANRSEVLPLSADKPPPRAGLFARLSRQTVRPDQANRSAVLTLSADKAPLAGLFVLLLRQTVRPAWANMSAVLPLSADKPPLAGLFVLLLRQTIRPAQANMSVMLPLSADKPHPYPRIRCGPVCGDSEQPGRPRRVRQGGQGWRAGLQERGQRPARRKRSARHGAGRALPGLTTGRTVWQVLRQYVRGHFTVLRL